MKKVLLLLILPIAILLIKTTSTQNLVKMTTNSLAKTFLESHEISAWHWDSPFQMQYEEQINLIKFSKQEGVKRIYISIDRYLDLFEKNETIKLSEFENSLSQFILNANKEGIAVEALAGGEEWSQSSHSYLPHLIMDYVISYNKRHPETNLSGVQLDIEFYNLKNYKKESVGLTKEYFSLLEELLIKSKREKLRFGVTAPYWFDNENGNSPAFVWNNKKAVPIEHLLDILGQSSNSYIVIMAYRNFAEGNGGTIELAKQEIDYAKKSTPNVEIIIGQETQKNSIQKVTFYSKPKATFVKEVNKIVTYFSGASVFKGIAIHTLQGFQELD